MSVIKPRTRGRYVIVQRIRLDRENVETLYAYAAFIEEDADYVVNQLVETVLAKDRDFAAWRRQQTHTFVPPRTGRRRTRTNRGSATPQAAPIGRQETVTAQSSRP